MNLFTKIQKECEFVLQELVKYDSYRKLLPVEIISAKTSKFTPWKGNIKYYLKNHFGNTSYDNRIKKLL